MEKIRHARMESYAKRLETQVLKKNRIKNPDGTSSSSSPSFSNILRAAKVVECQGSDICIVEDGWRKRMREFAFSSNHRRQDAREPKAGKVLIVVRGGCAYVAKRPRNVEVEIKDYDNEGR